MKKLTGYLTIALIRLLSLLPLPAARQLGRLAGILAYTVGGAFRRIAVVNIRLCMPRMSGSGRQMFIRNAFIQTGMMAAEMGLMWGRPPREALSHIRNIHGEALLQDALQAGKGVLLLAPHLGNWELTNTYIASRVSLTAMYRPARNPVFGEWLHKQREQTGAELVPTTTGGIKSLYRCLRSGGVVGVLPDQEPKPEGGEFAQFMGVNALTPTLPVQLLKRTGATALFIFARRLEGKAGFDIHIVKPDDGIYSADTASAVRAMNSTLERCIRVCPEQYQWLYKRFKRQPDARLSPYKTTEF